MGRIHGLIVLATFEQVKLVSQSKTPHKDRFACEFVINCLGSTNDHLENILVGFFCQLFKVTEVCCNCHIASSD